MDEQHRAASETSLCPVQGARRGDARQFHRWTGIPFLGLRFSNIMERADYQRFLSFWDDPKLRKWNLVGYVDESHVAQAVRRALEADVAGAEAFIIAADTVMRRPSSDLMAEVFPGVPGQGRPGRARHPARHRQGLPATRLRPRVHLEIAVLMDHHGDHAAQFRTCSSWEPGPDRPGGRLPEMVQEWLGFTLPQFPGSRWVALVLGTVVFLYGGWPSSRAACPRRGRGSRA